MRLARLGSMHATRLSFLRCLLRELPRDGWRFERGDWAIDDFGVGHALYSLHGPERSYSLVCFAHELPEAMRSDRVIATAWDATFTLHDGVPDAHDIVRLRTNVPLQEAGRISSSELVLSRANRSVRLFEHVIATLAAGLQPDVEQIDSVGYLMRTTAVYGSGKFGAADRAALVERPEIRGPFRIEMLAVWLIRMFTVDLVEHLARVRGGNRAVRLSMELARRIGVGNSTGLGMAPFLVNHPMLLNHWIAAREEALARVRSQPVADSRAIEGFRAALHDAMENARDWRSEHALQERKLGELRRDLDRLSAWLEELDALSGDHPWDRLWRRAVAAFSLEGQEALVSLLLEPHGELVDSLAGCMAADESAGFRIDGSMSLVKLDTIVLEHYGWALAIDHERSEGCARFWYTSAEKLEPRLGERHTEDGADYEQPLAISRDIQAMHRSLSSFIATQRSHAESVATPNVAQFLSAHPAHRHVVRRAQLVVCYPFAEIRDNLVSADLLPIDLLRCKLAFFGAQRFDPRSDRWVRISLYTNMPHPNELLA